MIQPLHLQINLYIGGFFGNLGPKSLNPWRTGEDFGEKWRQGIGSLCTGRCVWRRSGFLIVMWGLRWAVQASPPICRVLMVFLCTHACRQAKTRKWPLPVQLEVIFLHISMLFLTMRGRTTYSDYSVDPLQVIHEILLQVMMLLLADLTEDLVIIMSFQMSFQILGLYPCWADGRLVVPFSWVVYCRAWNSSKPMHNPQESLSMFEALTLCQILDLSIPMAAVQEK